MHDDICYTQNFLAEVIARVDFTTHVEALGRNIPEELANVATTAFPIAEPRESVAQQLQVSDEGVRHKKEHFKEWHYYGREREKRLVIARNAIFVAYSEYESYEKLADDFFAVLKAMFSAYPKVRGSRFGLRYINKIELAQRDPFDWRDFIDPDLLCLVNRYADPQSTTRVLHIVETKQDDLQMKFQFGLPNPDFPAPMRKPVFVLDLDCYVHGNQSLEEVSTNMSRAHQQIQQTFEDSIRDGLREVMGV